MDIDLNDERIYKKTYRKRLEVLVEIPKIGTAVSCGVTTHDKPVVLVWPSGDTYIVSLDELCNHYQSKDRTSLSLDYIKSECQKCRECGELPQFKVVSNRGKTCWATIVHSGIHTYVDTAKGKVEVNGAGSKHNLGDWVICPDINGKPDTSRKIVINGEVFPIIYNMKSFPNMSSTKQRRGLTYKEIKRMR